MAVQPHELLDTAPRVPRWAVFKAPEPQRQLVIFQVRPPSGAALGGLFAAPFGAFASVRRRSTAAVPSEAELSGLGARHTLARDKLPVSYDLERVADRMQAVEQATRRKYGRDAPQAAGTLRDLAMRPALTRRRSSP